MWDEMCAWWTNLPPFDWLKFRWNVSTDTLRDTNDTSILDVFILFCFEFFLFFFQIYFDREISNVFSMTLSLFNFICLREIYWRSLTVFRKWPKKGNFLFSYRLKRLFQKGDSTWNVSINCFLEDFHVKNALTFFEEEKKKKERKTK